MALSARIFHYPKIEQGGTVLPNAALPNDKDPIDSPTKRRRYKIII